MTILAILGSAVLFASFSANRAARTANTRAKVAALHSLVMEKYEEFHARQIAVPNYHLRVEQAKDELRAGKGGDPAKVLQALERDMVVAVRELMQMELPDRWSDVTFSEIASTPASTNLNLQKPRTALAQAYLNRFRQIAGATNRLTGQPNTRDEIIRFQGAECLYMIVTLGTANGEALSLFRESDIGDVDGDGAPEFLDAWGSPISFLRYPAGFVAHSDLMSGNALEDHDPFDPFRYFQSDFRVVPLIYSAGPDRDYDINVEYVAGNPPLLPGTPMNTDDDGSEGWHDNIHNHDKDAR